MQQSFPGIAGAGRPRPSQLKRHGWRAPPPWAVRPMQSRRRTAPESLTPTGLHTKGPSFFTAVWALSDHIVQANRVLLSSLHHAHPLLAGCGPDHLPVHLEALVAALEDLVLHQARGSGPAEERAQGELRFSSKRLGVKFGLSNVCTISSTVPWAGGAAHSSWSPGSPRPACLRSQLRLPLDRSCRESDSRG